MKKILYDNCFAIIAAGGSGQRFGENKLFKQVANLEVIIHTLIPFANLFSEEHIFIVVAATQLQEYQNIVTKYFPERTFNFVLGGECRGESVENAVKEISSRNADFENKCILIHDAARPLVTEELIADSITNFEENKEQFSGVVVAKKIVDTVKQVAENSEIMCNVDRSKLWAMETPQIFDLAKLIAAYNYIKNEGLQLDSFTDDAAIMNYSDFKVKIFANHKLNNKLTYQQDLQMMEILLQHKYMEKENVWR
ncbi:IspD/TarI family cytidylyltransferase [Lentisphaerota bacterium WC36G]|nr:2-C-methyl-D-erythritol 4-phosphate cytidylyltransferase [Lentisphaerae bacterium WC36]